MIAGVKRLTYGTGTCSDCGRTISLRKSGAVRQHTFLTKIGYQVCGGSWLAPVPGTAKHSPTPTGEEQG